MSFEDIIPSSTGTTGNYTALYNKTTQQIFPQTTPTKIAFNNTVSGIALSSNSYPIPLGAEQNGVSLNVETFLTIRLSNAHQTSAATFNVTLFVYKNSTPIYTEPYGNFTVPYDDISDINLTFTSPVTLAAGTFNQGDTISIYAQITKPSTSALYSSTIEPSYWNQLKITQYPAFTLPVTSSGANSIWGYANKTNYPYVITSSQSTLVNIYGDNNVKMSNITGSGFNPVTLPWSIEYGDEFRFEDREDFVYQVKKVFGPADSGSGRLFQTGSIEIHFNTPLPVSASTSAFNLDHFVIRRYVDDASQILMEGFAPIDSQGPYIVRPEFVVPELNKSVDQFILDLTQKGLIS
jgi:hypothetical protein